MGQNHADHAMGRLSGRGVVRQRIGGIANKVDQDLLHQHRVGIDPGKLGGHRPQHLDVQVRQVTAQQLASMARQRDQIAGFTLGRASGEKFTDAAHNFPGLGSLLALLLQRAHDRGRDAWRLP